MALPRRRLGSTGLDVAVVGVGCGHLGSCASDAAAAEVVQTFLAAGCNLVDTSPSYGSGQSERRLGLALAGVPRGSYALQSKCGDEGPQNGGHSPFSRAGVLASAEHSLRVLNTSFLDALLLHDPYKDELAAFLAPGGGMEAIRELRSAGIVRGFGLGCREHGAHLALLEALGPKELDVAVCVDDHNLLRRHLDRRGLRSALRAADIGIVNGAPLYRGLLTAEPSIYGSSGLRPAPELLELSGALRAFARARGHSLLDLATQFPLRTEDVASSIYGCTTAAQASEVLAAAQAAVAPRTWEELEAELGKRVDAVPASKHFYWFKRQRPGNVEWEEMREYPRDGFRQWLLPENITPRL